MKENTRECPDCDGSDYGSLFGNKGNGRCRQCKGTGEIHGFADAFGSIATFNTVEPYHTCEYCHGNGQCQTCGGTGLEYYNEDVYDNENDKSSTYSSYSDHASYSDYSGYSSSYDSDSSSSSSSSKSTKEKTISVFAYVFGIAGFLVACDDYTSAFGKPNGVLDAVGSKYFGIFLFLDLLIYPAIGALIGWIIVEIIFFFNDN